MYANSPPSGSTTSFYIYSHYYVVVPSVPTPAASRCGRASRAVGTESVCLAVGLLRQSDRQKKRAGRHSRFVVTLSIRLQRELYSLKNETGGC